MQASADESPPGRKRVAVMFSGGRDSSLAAVHYCLGGYEVCLLRFLTGLGIPSVLPAIREGELRAQFGGHFSPTPDPIPVYGLVRRICVADIESDFKNFQGKNLVLLGEKLALHAASVVFCLNNGIGVLADGTSGYQAEMPEQRPVALKFFRELSSTYEIMYETPIDEFQSDMDVRYRLLEAGISTKSLEGLSMFADSFTPADDDTILAYLETKKEIACSYINRFANKELSAGVAD